MSESELYLFYIGLVVWLVGTITAGGGAILFLSIAGLVLPIKEVAPVTSIAGGMVTLSRIGLFYQDIQWSVLKWLLSGSIIGVLIGAHFLAYIHPQWLTLVFALFLGFSALLYFIPGRYFSFQMESWYYFPVGVVTAFTSAFIGAVGPVVNVFFLKSNITKERMLATNALNILFVQIVKISTYIYVAHLDFEIGKDGLIAAAGAVAGTLIGKLLLPKVSNLLFRFLANVILLFCGIVLLHQYLTN